MTSELKIETLRALIDNSVSMYGDNLALSYIQKQKVSYQDMHHQIHRIDNWFLKHNIQKGSKVAIVGENSPHWAVVFFSITYMGAVAVPILPDFSDMEINNILAHSESEILFISHRLYQKHQATLDFKGPIVFLDHLEIAGSKSHLLDFDYDHAKDKVV
ncbi:MAG: AMP-binding protein, partial [Bacteroidales bacterium]